MKVLKFMSLLLFACLSFAACDLFDDEEQEDDGTVTWKNFFNVQVTRCERVGGVLLVEYDLTNKSGEDKTFVINGGSYNAASDDLGNTYYVSCAFGESDYAQRRSVLVKRGETVKGKFRLGNFDSTNKSQSVSFNNLNCTVSGETLTDDGFGIINIPITDNRVFSNGIQTCDKSLDFAMVGCERVGGVLLIDYTVTNNGTYDIANFQLDGGAYNAASDNLGNTYYVSCAFGKSDYAQKRSTRLNKGQTIDGHLKLLDFDPTGKAATINATIACGSSDYVLTDKHIRFLTIPITDNRVTDNGIQSCDRGLSFEVKSTSIDKDGVLRIYYTIKNNTEETIHNFSLGHSSPYAGSDDLNNAYYVYCSFNKSDFAFNNSTDIPAGTTIDAAIAFKDFNPRARYASASLPCSAKDYLLDDERLRFLNIPIEK